MDGLIEKILLATIALIVFSGLVGTVLTNLSGVNTSSNSLVTAIFPLIGFMFVIGVVLALYYGMVRKK